MDIRNLLHTIIDAPGIGGIIVVSIYTLALVVYVFLTRWILAGRDNRS